MKLIFLWENVWGVTKLHWAMINVIEQVWLMWSNFMEPILMTEQVCSKAIYPYITFS